MSIRNATTASFSADVLTNERPVLVDFWATWCPPCRAIAPTLEQLAAEHDGKLDIVKIDVDANPELARQFNVRNIPALKVFVGGKVVKELMGALPKAHFDAHLAEFVGG